MITSPQSRLCRKPPFLTLFELGQSPPQYYPQVKVPNSVVQSTSQFFKYVMSFETTLQKKFYLINAYVVQESSMLIKSSSKCAMRLKDVGLISSSFVSRKATETKMPI